MIHQKYGSAEMNRIAEAIDMKIRLAAPEGYDIGRTSIRYIVSLIDPALASLVKEITEKMGLASQDMLSELRSIIHMLDTDSLFLEAIPQWILTDLAIYVMDLDCLYDPEMDPYIDEWNGEMEIKGKLNLQTRNNLVSENVARMKEQYDRELALSGDAVAWDAMQVIAKVKKQGVKALKDIQDFNERLDRMEAELKSYEEAGRSAYREEVPF